MNIYYVKFDDDDDWVLIEETEFFSSREDADKSCAEKNAANQARHDIQQESAFQQWQISEEAFTALESIMDPQKISTVLKYHKRTFTKNSFIPRFEVTSIEVID